MALRGNFSQSFLRSKELLSFSEISYDKEGNYILENKILKEALTRDNNGNFIRNKVNIAKILNKYGVLYRMLFNAMNMDQYTYDEVQEALDYLSEYINDLGVSGIIEFHAADKTQNSDHIHFWINSEDKLIYNRIAQEMVAMGYSNEEDVHIQKYDNNQKLNETDYVKDKDSLLSDRFKEPLEIENSYDSILKNISNIFQGILTETDSKIENKNLDILHINNKNSVFKKCTLTKTEEINNILLRINELQNQIDT